MRNVLVVEDSEVERELIRRVLNPLDCVVIEAGTLAVAFPMLDDPDLELIILDLHLPNGHGRRLVEELKSRRDDVPIVILTGHVDDARSLEAFPVTSVLDKPINFPEFRKAIQKAVETAGAIRNIRENSRRLTAPRFD